MALDRGTLAKIDRRVFAELDHAEGVQLANPGTHDGVRLVCMPPRNVLPFALRAGRLTGYDFELFSVFTELFLTGAITHDLRT